VHTEACGRGMRGEGHDAVRHGAAGHRQAGLATVQAAHHSRARVHHTGCLAVCRYDKTPEEVKAADAERLSKAEAELAAAGQATEAMKQLLAAS
jgi:hypothetical protein